MTGGGAVRGHLRLFSKEKKGKVTLKRSQLTVRDLTHQSRIFLLERCKGLDSTQTTTTALLWPDTHSVACRNESDRLLPLRKPQTPEQSPVIFQGTKWRSLPAQHSCRETFKRTPPPPPIEFPEMGESVRLSKYGHFTSKDGRVKGKEETLMSAL